MASELAAEGSGLEGGEEGVELGQVGALEGFLLLDGFDDGGEAVLEGEGGLQESEFPDTCRAQIEVPCGCTGLSPDNMSVRGKLNMVL